MCTNRSESGRVGGVDCDWGQIGPVEIICLQGAKIGRSVGDTWRLPPFQRPQRLVCSLGVLPKRSISDWKANQPNSERSVDRFVCMICFFRLVLVCFGRVSLFD